VEDSSEGGEGPGAKAVVDLTLTCSTPEEARAVWAALEADDPGSIQGEVDGAIIRVRVGPANLSSLRVTIDDVLSCFQAARGAAAHAECPVEDQGGP
jgi:hypothetical protein